MKKELFVSIFLSLLLILGIADDSYAEEFAFQGSCQVFCEDSRFGIRDAEGCTVLSALFDGILPIVGDYCVVQLDGLEGVYSLQGEQVIECAYETIELYDQAFILGKDLSHYSLYDARNRQTVADGCSYISSLNDGAAFVVHKIDDNGNECIGIISANGDYIYDCKYRWIEYYNSGVMVLYNQDFEETYYFPRDDLYAANRYEGYLFDHQGDRVTPVYESVSEENGDGMFAYRQGNSWYIARVQNADKAQLLAGPFVAVDDPERAGRSPYYIGNAMYAIPAENGTIVWSANADQQVLLEGVLSIAKAEGAASRFRKGEKWGYLFSDLSMIPARFDYAAPFLQDYSLVELDGFCYGIDKAGNLLENQKYALYFPSNRETNYFTVERQDGILCALDLQLRMITILQGDSFG